MNPKYEQFPGEQIWVGAVYLVHIGNPKIWKDHMALYFVGQRWKTNGCANNMHRAGEILNFYSA